MAEGDAMQVAPCAGGVDTCDETLKYVCSVHYNAAHAEEACRCREGREAAMVTLARDQNGTPTVWCDPCIAPLVKALNDAGIATVASCCGHGEQHGSIVLADGRELVIRSFTRTLDAEGVCMRCGVPDVHCMCPDVTFNR
jgi:hypothetical protein